MIPDKRRFKRVPCEFNSSFNRFEGGSLPSIWQATVKDISQGGVRFRSNELVPVRSRLLMKLDIPHRKLISALIEPAWVREIPSTGQFEIGASFLTLSDEDKGLIKEFISRPRQVP